MATAMSKSMLLPAPAAHSQNPSIDCRYRDPGNLMSPIAKREARLTLRLTLWLWQPVYMLCNGQSLG